MELGVSHEQSLSSSTPIVDNIFDKYNKNLVPIRSLSDHDKWAAHSGGWFCYRDLLGFGLFEVRTGSNVSGASL